MSDVDPDLVLGPILRRVTGTRATIWVQTARPGVVRVRAGRAGGAARTFTVYDQHYALVVVDGLTPGETVAYEVLADGRRVWPPPAYPFPPSAIRTRGDDGRTRLVFGSCRQSTQRVTRRFPPDALDAYAVRLARSQPDAGAGAWPDSLVLLGDQVYADETSPAVREWLLSQPRPGAPAEQVASFAEYTRLYLESWSDPEIRWLLSTVPSVMIFDDHEIIDDWNASESWRADMAREPWWAERISAGLASYWIYQHLGNLDPDALAADPLYPQVIAADDATGLLCQIPPNISAATPVDLGFEIYPGRGAGVCVPPKVSVACVPSRGRSLPRWAAGFLLCDAAGRQTGLTLIL